MKISTICTVSVALIAAVVTSLIDSSRERARKENHAPAPEKTPVPPPFADIKRPEVSEDEFFHGLNITEAARE